MVMLRVLILCLFCVYKVFSICTNTDDFAIEVIIALDGTTTDVDAQTWTNQVAAVNELIFEMKNNTMVAITELGTTFTSTPSYQTVDTIKEAGGVSPSQSNTISLRDPDATLDSALNYGFTDTFAVQKILVILTTGEVTATGVNHCGNNYELKRKMIETVVIGVGESFYPGYTTDSTDGYAYFQFNCLTKDTQNTDGHDAFKIATNFTQLSTAISELKDSHFCIANDAYLFIVTEIKSQGTLKYVELLNYGRSITTSSLTFSGFLVGNGGGNTVVQGQMVVFTQSGATTQCSNCEVILENAAVFEIVSGWSSTTEPTLTVTIGSSSTTITISNTNNEWFLLGSGFSYEFHVLGGKQEFSDNWISSHTITGTPGGYDYLNTEIRPILEEGQGSIRCTQISQNGVNCGACYNTLTGFCDCTDIGSDFYPNPLDPGICKLIPQMSSSGLGCKIFKRGKGISTTFNFGFTSPNTDMPWDLYITYPRATTPVYWPISSGRTHQPIPSSASNANRGFTSSTDVTISDAGSVGVSKTSDGTIVGTLTTCSFKTSAPSVAPTDAPSVQPTITPTMNPTKKPTNGEPFVFFEALGSTSERYGCTRQICDGYDTPRITRIPDTNIDDLTPDTINIIDGIIKIDASFSEIVSVNWKIEFLQICSIDIGNFNVSNYSCDFAITNKSALADAFFPPLNLNDTSNANFTFTTDIIVEPMNGTINITGTGLDRRSFFSITEFKADTFLEQPTFLNGAYLAQYLLTIESCNQPELPEAGCNIVYPNVFILEYQIGKSPDGQTRIGNEIPTWIWWIIIPLLIFLGVIAFLVYKYWWKKKKTDEVLAKEENDLDDMIKENELGFANDLDVGNIRNNPLAKVNPAMTGPVNPGRVDPKPNQNQRIDEVARVKVENFNTRVEYGQTKQQQRNIVADDGRN